ncbi:hypothetical protein EI77_04529 [Prosthecobacter fusiformis]|uniref:Uncharacterized protein n=2 Tax=Prosthecobacter fusiformis TaxID=48464 RepID=A0A4R7RID9_9BACT|nr:hypothetical protein EI77_04529 [Prosthecobacter fusiformis]
MLGTLNIQAQTPEKAKARELEDVLEDIPSKDILKLRGSTKQVAATEISSKLVAAEVTKETTFKLKVDKVIPWSFPQQGNVQGWRANSNSERIRCGSVMFDTNIQLYIKQDPKGLLEKMRPGTELVVTGKVSRCDITVPGKVFLNMDIQVSDFAEAN